MKKPLLKPLKILHGRKRFFKTGSSPDNIHNKIDLQLLIKCICAFLLSRTSLIGGAVPLGFSLFAAVKNTKGAYLCALCAVLGLIFSGAGFITVGKYIIAISIFSLIEERFLPAKYKTAKINSAVSALCVLLSGLFLLFADVTFGGYPLIYDVMVLIVECATIYVFSLAFSVSVPLVFDIRLRRSLSTEETVSLSLLAGGVLCGFGTAGIPGIFSLTGVLCVLCVLIFAVRFGSLHGCSAGIIMGVISCLSSGRIDAGAASFALSGLCAGYFSRYGKWSACVSFIISNAIVTIMSNGSTEVLINISDTLVAALILYLIPKRAFNSISRFSSSSPPRFELAAQKLKSAQNTVCGFEKSFNKIFHLRNNEENNALMLYRRTARNICSSCGLRKYCWGRDIMETKKSMDILSSMLKNLEPVTAQNAPPHCLRGEQFVFEFQRMFEVYKNDCMWTEKINEFRACVYTSFSGISSVIGSCADMLLSEDECDTIAADNIKYHLRKEGILCESVFVSGTKEETSVRIKLDTCGGFGRCENAVYKVLENLLGMPFVRTGLRSCGECIINYVVKPSFSVTTAVASAIKANRKVSGDYVLYSLVDRHTYAIILCDGMGSGETAREESRTCAQFLMKLLEAKIEPQTAINIINAMLLCSFSESLAAIDLCLINLDDGSSKIYKCGGASTYAKTQDSVSHIQSNTMPAGSFTAGDTRLFTISSQKGSMLVLLSDGITSSENAETSWIQKMIKDFDGKEPESLAQMILKQAKTISNKKADDDLTVVATYIG